MKSDSEFIQEIMMRPIPGPDGLFVPVFTPLPPKPIQDPDDPDNKPAVNKDAVLQWQEDHGDAFTQALHDQWPEVYARRQLQYWQAYKTKEGIV
jgi:hypothetical protein